HRNAAALWGLKSKEWGGDGHSRLVFDDSDDQLRLQLATTHQASQLNLGHLVHQADNYRGSFRGEGFELRSDAWGTVRAQSGLWLSAYGTAGETPAGEAVAPDGAADPTQDPGPDVLQCCHHAPDGEGGRARREPVAERLADDRGPVPAAGAAGEREDHGAG